MRTKSLFEIYDEASMADNSGTLNWVEIGFDTLCSWVAWKDSTGDSSLSQCDLESVKGSFERWYRDYSARRDLVEMEKLNERRDF